jgi:hypothetical protein
VHFALTQKTISSFFPCLLIQTSVKSTPSNSSMCAPNKVACKHIGRVKFQQLYLLRGEFLLDQSSSPTMQIKACCLVALPPSSDQQVIEGWPRSKGMGGTASSNIISSEGKGGEVEKCPNSVKVARRDAVDPGQKETHPRSKTNFTNKATNLAYTHTVFSRCREVFVLWSATRVWPYAACTATFDAVSETISPVRRKAK